MSNQDNKQIVHQFFQCFSAADTSGALDLTSESVIWRAMGREGELPLSGERDKEMIAQLICDVKATFPDGIKLTPTGWTCEGNRVAVEVESFATKLNGTVYNNLYHFLIEVVDGKITLIREYFDTLHVKAVFIDDQ